MFDQRINGGYRASCASTVGNVHVPGSVYADFFIRKLSYIPGSKSVAQLNLIRQLL